MFENLLVAAVHGRGRSVGDATDVCAGILEQTGLIARANAPAGSLTLLERKRLEMARALATGPKLLLLDEIAGGLTEGECHELVATIRGIRAGGTTIVWIEHIVHALRGGGRPAGRAQFRPQDRGRATRRTVMASAEVREIYMGLAA